MQPACRPFGRSSSGQRSRRSRARHGRPGGGAADASRLDIRTHVRYVRAIPVYFSADAVHFHDGTAERATYRVDLPHLPYDGRVRVTGLRHAAGDVEQWIADRLDDMAARLGYDVLCGRLYSQVDLPD